MKEEFKFWRAREKLTVLEATKLALGLSPNSDMTREEQSQVTALHNSIVESVMADVQRYRDWNAEWNRLYESGQLGFDKNIEHYPCPDLIFPQIYSYRAACKYTHQQYQKWFLKNDMRPEFFFPESSGSNHSLLKVHEWLTLDQAAKVVSKETATETSRIDIMRLCLSKDLKLFVWLRSSEDIVFSGWFPKEPPLFALLSAAKEEGVELYGENNGYTHNIYKYATKEQEKAIKQRAWLVYGEFRAKERTEYYDVKEPGAYEVIFDDGLVRWFRDLSVGNTTDFSKNIPDSFYARLPSGKDCLVNILHQLDTDEDKIRPFDYSRNKPITKIANLFLVKTSEVKALTERIGVVTEHAIKAEEQPSTTDCPLLFGMSNLTYDEMTIKFIEGLRLEVSARGSKRIYTLGELELINKQSGALNNSALILLGMTKGLGLPNDSKNAKPISRLRSLIKDKLPALGDPFLIEGQFYVSNIKIQDERDRAKQRAASDAQKNTYSYEDAVRNDFDDEDDIAGQWLEDNDI